MPLNTQTALCFVVLLSSLSLVMTKEMADGCGMNPLLALVAVADKTGQSVESLMSKFSSDKLAFREFVTLLGRYESCIRVGSGTRYRRSPAAFLDGRSSPLSA